jgi:hypothetical protein
MFMSQLQYGTHPTDITSPTLSASEILLRLIYLAACSQIVEFLFSNITSTKLNSFQSKQ